MSQQDGNPKRPESAKDREPDDWPPGGDQQGGEDRASVIRPPRPAGIPSGGFPPHLPAPNDAPAPFPAPNDAPALSGDSILDPD